MGERPYCSTHQRYLRQDGSCIDCEKLELALSYAQDVVDAYPQMTIRNMSQMHDKIKALEEALKLVKDR